MKPTFFKEQREKENRRQGGEMAQLPSLKSEFHPDTYMVKGQN